MIEQAGLRWTAVESVPVHEDIKTGRGDLSTWFSHYCTTLVNLASEGIRTVIYNFMPVLAWNRTGVRHTLADGTQCLLYDPAKFSAFEIHALQRQAAHADYTPDQIHRGTTWWNALNDSARHDFVQSIIDVFPGVKLGLGLDDIRAMLSKYDHLKPGDLENNLARFHEAVIPTAERAGMKLAIPPDDPPFPVLGLPRIVSTAAQVRAMLARVPSRANGLCFCTGSFSAREDNDLIAMVREFAPSIHATHLRSTQRLADGSFFEAEHLAGSVPMPAIVAELLAEQDRRRAQGLDDWRLAFRPDHGHTMLDDLEKVSPTDPSRTPVSFNPGYTCIGRMKGLAELRGLMLGIRFAQRSSERRSH